MLSIGLEQQHHCRVGLLPLLAALLQNALYAAWPGKFLHRMEPQRGRLALQKLVLSETGIGPRALVFWGFLWVSCFSDLD
jgi:hypothetical protein